MTPFGRGGVTDFRPAPFDNLNRTSGLVMQLWMTGPCIEITLRILAMNNFIPAFHHLVSTMLRWPSGQSNPSEITYLLGVGIVVHSRRFKRHKTWHACARRWTTLHNMQM